MKESKIEWTDHTFNPWIGCTKVSPGCAHCYAEALNQRWSGGENWGKGAPRRRTSDNNWRQPLNWDRDYLVKPFVCLACGKRCRHEDCVSCEYEATQRPRPRVFCASLADWLDDEVPLEWLCNLLETVHACQNLDWLMLTKRPQNWDSRLQEVLRFAAKNEDRSSRDSDRHDRFFHWLNLWLNAHEAPENLWIGTTVEDQARVHERISHLLKIPAFLRFVSCEPLLEPIDLYAATKVCWSHPSKYSNWRETPHEEVEWRMQSLVAANWKCGLHWVIAGGESGAGHREMDLAAIHHLDKQCRAAGIPLFIKQDSGSRAGMQGRIPDQLWARKEFPNIEVKA